ncbi:MAG: hypothetical protein ACR2NX_10830 [Chthoniobacterales bacterium]
MKKHYRFLPPFAAISFAGWLLTLSLAKADVTSVPPFTGASSETFEEFGRRLFSDGERIPIFGGTAVISGTRLETAHADQFLLCVYYASPVDGQFFLGADQYGSSMVITFSQPVSTFGAYWANLPDPQGCDGGDTNFVFHDAAGNTIGGDVYPAGHTSSWHWHGWAFTTPVTTITVSGDFLLADGMQANFAPSGLASGGFSNISTRARVETDDNVLIGGFIVTGESSKRVLIRALGPTLPLPGSLADPTLELRNADQELIMSNDNWQDAPNWDEISATGLAPGDPREAAILTRLPPGPVTAILRGAGNTAGIALVEVYDLEPGSAAKLGNVSTRGFVQTGDDIMIGGIIIVCDGAQRTFLRALGPSLPVPGALADPTLELRDVNGSLVAANDDWRSTQEAEIIATNLAPADGREAALVQTLPAGNYTALVRGGGGGVGVALVEAYAVP